ncbi:hypothetical protein BX666DRAFT_2030096 [Dichotomocladium elegans]|nr:hypothetical protein BX666DRAFT_2030096 [Dichotomocladium elegans]
MVPPTTPQPIPPIIQQQVLDLDGGDTATNSQATAASEAAAATTTRSNMRWTAAEEEIINAVKGKWGDDTTKGMNALSRIAVKGMLSMQGSTGSPSEIGRLAVIRLKDIELCLVQWRTLPLIYPLFGSFSRERIGLRSLVLHNDLATS